MKMNSDSLTPSSSELTCIICMEDGVDVKNYADFYKCECKICNFHLTCFNEYNSKIYRCPICRSSQNLDVRLDVLVEIVRSENNHQARNNRWICPFLLYRSIIMVNMLIFMIFSNMLFPISMLIILFSGIDLAYNLHETLMSTIVRSYMIPVRYTIMARTAWTMITIARIFVTIVSVLSFQSDIFPIYYYSFNCTYMCIEGVSALFSYRRDN